MESTLCLAVRQFCKCLDRMPMEPHFSIMWKKHMGTWEVGGQSFLESWHNEKKKDFDAQKLHYALIDSELDHSCAGSLLGRRERTRPNASDENSETEIFLYT